MHGGFRNNSNTPTLEWFLLLLGANGTLPVWISITNKVSVGQSCHFHYFILNDMIMWGIYQHHERSRNIVNPFQWETCRLERQNDRNCVCLHCTRYDFRRIWSVKLIWTYKWNCRRLVQSCPYTCSLICAFQPGEITKIDIYH